MKKYWHVCTEGLKRRIIFSGKEDFVFGMNGIPVYCISETVYP